MAWRLRVFAFALAAALLAAGPSVVRAEWQQGEGSYVFGPDMSEAEACGRAMVRARREALTKVSGTRVSFDDVMVCSEGNDNASCTMDRLAWSSLDGKIMGQRGESKAIKDVGHGLKECTSRIEIDVPEEAASDPSFDMTVNLERSVLRDRESVRVFIAPSQPMYLSVFQWSPKAGPSPQLARLYPNNFHKGEKVDKPVAIPPLSDANSYRLTVRFPERGAEGAKVADEYLIVLGTRQQVAFRDTYEFEEFRARLAEIPSRDLRMVRRGYAIVRAQ